jgi:DNA-binding PadR family transcriptional regulator
MSDFLETLHERILRDYIDIVILAKVREKEVTGYELISYFHQRFDFMVSPGTVYAILYSLERKGLIQANDMGNKRTYKLTIKGKEALKLITGSLDSLTAFFRKVLTVAGEDKFEHETHEKLAQRALGPLLQPEKN